MANEKQPTGQAASRGALAGLLACGLFTTIGLFSLGPVLPQIARHFNGTPHVELLTELVITSASFSFAVGAPFSGALIARLGCRRIIVPALVIFALAGAAPALMNDLWLIVATRVCLGLALSAIFTGALTGIGAQPDELRTRLFGWISVVGGVAAIMIYPMIGELGKMGWRPAFLVNLTALLVVPLVLLLPRSLGTAQASLAQDQEVKGRRGDAVLGPTMVGLLIVAAMVGMGMLINPIYSPLYLAKFGITDTPTLAVPATLGSLAAVAGSAIYGRLHTKLGINGIFVAAMLIIGCALIVAGMALNVPLFIAMMMILGAMTAIVVPNINAAALAFSPPGKASQAIGLVNGVMFGAQLPFPFFAAWLKVSAGLSAVFVIFGCGMLLIGIAIAVRASVRRSAIA